MTEAVPGEAWHIRYTALTAELSRLLVERVLPDFPKEITLGEHTFAVQAVAAAPEGHAAAGTASYADLASPYLLGSITPPTRWEFAFHAPTAFRSRGRTIPIPLPDLLFGSLLDRWNAWSPVALNPEVRRFAQECMAISKYRLQSKMILGKGDRVHRGAVGRCTYTALNRDRYWCSTVSALAAFSFYSGAGYQTTQGLGVCRWLER